MMNQKVRPILDIGRRTLLGDELLYAQAKEYFHYLNWVEREVLIKRNSLVRIIGSY